MMDLIENLEARRDMLRARLEEVERCLDDALVAAATREPCAAEGADPDRVVELRGRGAGEDRRRIATAPIGPAIMSALADAGGDVPLRDLLASGIGSHAGVKSALTQLMGARRVVRVARGVYRAVEDAQD